MLQDSEESYSSYDLLLPKRKPKGEFDYLDIGDNVCLSKDVSYTLCMYWVEKLANLTEYSCIRQAGEVKWA
jgi:hypothetical protein